MKAAPTNILVFISEEDRRKVFEKEFTRNDGTVGYLTTGIRAGKGEEDSFTQSVTVGRVVAVGNEVSLFEKDELVLIDYIVDTDDSFTVYSDERGKLVSLNAITTFHPEDLVVDANRRTPHPTIVYTKGELDKPSLVIGVIRNGALVPNKPYVIMAHEPEPDFEVQESGLVVVERKTAVERVVIAVYDGCRVAAGRRVMVEDEAIFTRGVGQQKWDIAFEQDILLEL